eukprot:Skav206685  [mRNA]  locus=scaffold1895:286241:286626:- [translate_table: standard]
MELLPIRSATHEMAQQQAPPSSLPLRMSHLLVDMTCLARGRCAGFTTRRDSTKDLISPGFKFHRLS